MSGQRRITKEDIPSIGSPVIVSYVYAAIGKINGNNVTPSSKVIGWVLGCFANHFVISGNTDSFSKETKDGFVIPYGIVIDLSLMSILQQVYPTGPQIHEPDEAAPDHEDSR